MKTRIVCFDFGRLMQGMPQNVASLNASLIGGADGAYVIGTTKCTTYQRFMKIENKRKNICKNYGL